MSPRTKNAIVLFAHGARDARWALPLQQLQSALAHARPQTSVQVAFLDLQKPSLAEALRSLAASGHQRIDIAPVFWSQGGHVTQDLPALVREFSSREPQVTLRLLPVLSELPGMNEFVAQAILAQTKTAP
ncbi:MAG TPA: CbiX/SirB N-terminal domain-containing protein [Burkholderiaceae bacterium]|nr:CbiX/SirB N-terminal domain-containing protein [Burkholderiaceae bacterium]